MKHGINHSVWITASSKLFPTAVVEVKHLLPHIKELEWADMDEVARKEDVVIFMTTYKAISNKTKLAKLKAWMGSKYRGVVSTRRASKLTRSRFINEIKVKLYRKHYINFR